MIRLWEPAKYMLREGAQNKIVFFLGLSPKLLAHRYATFLLKYSIGWRPQKDSIEKRSD